jgi:signal peptidase I
VLGGMRVSDAVGLFLLPLHLIGASHAAQLAARRDPSTPITWCGRWYVVLGIPAGYGLLLLTFCKLLFNPYYLPSEAMLPNYAVNDKFLASRRAYDSHEPSRGDVVAYHLAAKNVVFIKRIIGLPHDRVAMSDGVVYLNGKPLPRAVVKGRDFSERLPDGRSFVIRKFYPENGPYDNFAEVTVPAGHYYVLGDNRDNSLDSRFEQVGFIARENIVGPVVVKLFDGATRHFVFQSVR